MPNTNAAETIRHLQDQIRKEAEEMRSLEEKIKTMDTEANKLRTEIPLLQKKIEDEKKIAEIGKHKQIELGSEIPKLRAQLNKLKLAKLKLQSDLNLSLKTLQDAAKHSSLK